MFSTVDFPAPELPRIMASSPFSMEKFTSLTNGQVDARDLAKNVLDQTKTNKTSKRSIAKTTKPKEDKKDVN